jgi:hypothetical protein
MCVTDHMDCCETSALGNWYYPNGDRIELNDTGGIGPRFLGNRGQNEIINDQQFYGSVRLWRIWTPPQRGIFRCELPDANGVNQSLYVNICEFPGSYYTLWFAAHLEHGCKNEKQHNQTTTPQM